MLSAEAIPAPVAPCQATRCFSGGLLWRGCAVVCRLIVLMLITGCQEPSTGQSASAVIELTDANFQHEVVESEQPVLVEFWAPWCRACLEMQPAIEQLAQEFRGQATVAMLNTDANPETAARLGVDSPPVIIILQNGSMMKRRSGRQTKDSLTELLSGLTTGGDVRRVARLSSRKQ